jgi:hypothetical protein
MLLRASSEEIGSEVDLRSTIGDHTAGDQRAGVEHGDALVAFAEAATRGSDDLDGARAALRTALGPEAFVEAAATVGIFNGLVRVADSTGIPLDQGTRGATTEVRDALGLNEFGGSANTDLDADPGDASSRDVSKLFS